MTSRAPRWCLQSSSLIEKIHWKSSTGLGCGTRRTVCWTLHTEEYFIHHTSDQQGPRTRERDEGAVSRPALGGGAVALAHANPNGMPTFSGLSRNTQLWPVTLLFAYPNFIATLLPKHLQRGVSTSVHARSFIAPHSSPHSTQDFNPSLLLATMVSAAGDTGAPLKEPENNAPAAAKTEQPHAATVEDVDDVPDPDEDDLDDLDGRRPPERAQDRYLWSNSPDQICSTISRP